MRRARRISMVKRKGVAGVLKIWVYELIPRMADLNYYKVVDPTAVPRILRGRTTTSVPEMRKLNNYFFQSKESVQLRALCPSEEEMRQPYWSWPQDRPAVVSAESIPSSCADLDELKKVEVRRDLALLKERTNRCVVSHLFKGSEEMDDIQWDEGPSNRNEGEEKEDEGIEGGEGPSNRNEGEEKEEEGIEGGEVQGKPSEVEEGQRKRSEGEQVQIKSSEGEEAQRKSSEGEEVKRNSSKGEELQRKKREGKEVKRQRSEEKEVQRNQCEKEDNEVMLLEGDIGESTEGTKVEFTVGDIDLDQPTAVLSQLNVWLNDKGKAVEQGVQLRKRKRIIPMWKIIEGSELVPKTLAQTTGLQMLDPLKAIPHDDLVNLLKLCWEWRHNPNLVMQFGNVETEIEFFASLIKADGWLKGDVSLIDYAFVLMYIDYEIDKKNMLQHIDLGLYLIRKRQQQLEEVGIADWTTTDVFFIVSLILDDIVKEELAPLSITLPNLLNTIDFYEQGVYANNCSRDWWCPWPIERVDVPQQSNQ
ncbi:hypothetical protein L3X38_000936 [Prunus dulcis]|uniref:Uncharacterized protein n=1 Tax=Prunus dulcis TaxID=3755 RepID=A0AAD4WSL8_PRUDU|nr:hypothetical protein L3X38_000936 [Prunus dulcis]